METSKTTNKFSPEVRERAVRMVREHRGDHASQWAAIASIAAKIGCSGETLRNWVRQAERDAGVRPGATTDERERIKAQLRTGRVRHARMGRLVQQSKAAGADRKHSAGRSRSALLCATRRARHRGVTQTKRPPANPGRFTTMHFRLLGPSAPVSAARTIGLASTIMKHVIRYPPIA